MRCEYFPIDVDTETLSHSAQELASAFPLLFVHCLGATYHKGLRALPPYPGARLFVFLGSSLGNMEWQEIDDLLSELFGSGTRGDYFFLVADLDKDPAIIDRPYNDSAGYGPRSALKLVDHLTRTYLDKFLTETFPSPSKYDF